MTRETFPTDWKRNQWTCKSFQHVARHPKPNDECTSWVDCQGHWDLHTKNEKCTTKKWLEKREGKCRKIQQT